MISTWIKMAWRHARSSGFYTLLNIIGLTTGLVVAFLIGIWIVDELRFNSIHRQHDQLAQVMLNTASSGAITTGELLPIPLADVLKNRYGHDFPKMALVFPNYTHVVASGDKKLSQSGVWAQPSFPDMLTLPMVEGHRNALEDRSAVLVSRSLAVSLFGHAEPMGKMVRIDNVIEVRVGGVYEDLPATSSFYGTQVILSWDKAKDEMPWFKEAQTQWDAPGFRLYVELNPAADVDRLSGEIGSALSPFIKDLSARLFLHPMNKWHLYSEFRDGRIAGGRIRLVWLFGGIGLFVLLLACINFMNLATARSEKRAKEIGIRKTLGSLRRQLIGQFLCEALIVALISGLLAFLLSWVLFPSFNRLAGKEMVFPYEEWWFVGSGLVFVLLIGMVSGSYPAFYLSRFQPVKVLKGNRGDRRLRQSQEPGAKLLRRSRRAGPLAVLPRKVLVVIQFTVAVSLIIGTLLVHRQIEYAKDRPVGYSREGLLTVGINTPELYQASYNSLRASLMETGAVADMCESLDRSTEEPESARVIDWDGKDPSFTPAIVNLYVTHDYGHTLGWEVVEGRDFSREYPTDSDAVILNETAARMVGMWPAAGGAGRTIRLLGKPHTVIGVVRDMVMASPWRHTPPEVFRLSYNAVNFVTVRVNPALAMSAALPRIEKVFQRYNPSSVFDPRFVDQDFAAKFSDEQRVAALSSCFTVLAILISCLGLLGLSAYELEQRQKEIGIRKILGASAFGIAALLARDFVRLVLLACLVAIPLSFILVRQWLQQYEYRTGLSPWVFAVAAGGAMGIALLTVGYNALKAAGTNPIKSLRAE